MLRFWFGVAPGRSGTPLAPFAWWFDASPQIDARIAERFGGTLADAAAGRLLAWEAGARSSLALVLVLDQFPRHIDRGTPRAFANDEAALAVARRAVAAGHLQRLAPLEQLFALMPFQHAEDLAVQDECLCRWEDLTEPACAEELAVLAPFLARAREHRALIARFGRFPHRNAILGRASSESELAYLEEEPSTFGQEPRKASDRSPG
ncbi:MAG TPA: DUF924 domain-containing protein [Deltaproteobacteria bacterium]|nr:DUF924 domain-containing protein [Deltaproteobacteria bacterium]